MAMGHKLPSNNCYGHLSLAEYQSNCKAHYPAYNIIMYNIIMYSDRAVSVLSWMNHGPCILLSSPRVRTSGLWMHEAIKHIW